MQLKEHQLLDNQFLVEEVQYVKDPKEDRQLEVQVKEGTINYLHHAEAVVQHSSKWQE
jgi:hypothetical protein